MTDLEALRARRLANWGQTPETRLPDPVAAARLIDRVGLATLFPASPEVPNLFHAYVGTPDAATDSSWDSPSGHVYGWRWSLGRPAVAFYSALVRGRPTWVSWPLLPSLLRLRGELRDPEDLYEDGLLSLDAHRIAAALERAGGVLSTGELRRAASFPTGKAERAAYLKAVGELEARLLVAKVFAPDAQDDEMRHALVRLRYPDQVAAAARLGRKAAVDRLLVAYLPQAVYARSGVLAKDLKVPEAELRAGLERLVAAGRAETRTLSGGRERIYVWNG